MGKRRLRRVIPLVDHAKRFLAFKLLRREAEMVGELLDTIDLIYSAAIDPAGWQAVLSRLAAMTGCIAGGLTVEDPVGAAGRPLTFFGFDPDHVEKCFDHYLPKNPLFAIEAKMQPGFVVTNEMVVETASFRRSEFYDGWARPQGLCSPLSLVLHRQDGRYMPLTLVRPDGAKAVPNAHVELLKALSPHLIRATGIAMKLEGLYGFQNALHDCLDSLSAGVMLLDHRDRVLRVNAAAERYLTQGLITVRRGEIHAARPATDLLLQQALAARRHNPGIVMPDVAIRGHDDQQLVASVVPVATGELSFGDRRVAAMLVLRSPDPAGASDIVATFAAAHGLTKRESALLEMLATDGASLAECAERLHISLATAKTHLQRTFAKTATRRQAELIAMLFRSAYEAH